MDDQNDPSEIKSQANLPTVQSNQSISAYERARKGTTAISEVGSRYRSLQNLKMGSETIRTDDMINTIIARMLAGESLLSVTTDPDMPSHSTIMMWCRNDPDLRAAIAWARAEGVQLLYDARQDIVSGGYFSTGDKERDFELARVIKDTAAVRNRGVFGDKVEVTSNTINYVVKKNESDW